MLCNLETIPVTHLSVLPLLYVALNVASVYISACVTPTLSAVCLNLILV